jgi:dipeptidase E
VRTVLTLGGGGFSMVDRDEDLPGSLLDGLALSLTGKSCPRVCFVPTASGDADSYVARFRAAFAGRADPVVLSLFGNVDGPVVPIDRLEQVMDMDLIYVGGGSTANLLVLWRRHGLDVLLGRAADRGVVLAGISAGMTCWFQGSSTDSFGPLAALRDGLGFLPGSACPHYLGEPDRRPAFLRMVAEGELPDGYAADDGVALLWRDGVLIEAVSERPDAVACHVARRNGGAVETSIPVRYLG